LSLDSKMSGSGNAEKQVSQLAAQLAADRKRLVLHKRPFATLYHFLIAAGKSLVYCARVSVQHILFKLVVLPSVLAYAVAKSHNYFPAEISELEEWASYGVWWFGLGVLSSIGLGTGMHSGLLFLFPHVLKVCLAAEKCGNMNFDSRSDKWWSSRGFHCLEGTDAEPPEFFNIFKKVIFTGIVWGIGTAAGEIPPYAISYQAAKAGKENSEMGSMEVPKQQKVGVITYALNYCKTWMFNLIKGYGFWAVLLLSSWPNAMFDLCGICCGHFMLPFWEFFGAVLLGKGFFKVSLQTYFLVTVFSKEHREELLSVVEWLVPGRIPFLDQHLPEQYRKPPAEVFHTIINKEIAKFQEGLAKRAASSSSAPATWGKVWGTVQSWEGIKTTLIGLVPRPWSAMMSFLIGAFLVSCIHQIAQQHAAEEDLKIIEAARKAQ